MCMKNIPSKEIDIRNINGSYKRIQFKFFQENEKKNDISEH